VYKTDSTQMIRKVYFCTCNLSTADMSDYINNVTDLQWLFIDIKYLRSKMERHATI